jgi:glycosyltransferase involved in cell wall biosynthesis
MRVAIDLTALLPQPTGVDTYLLQLVEQLAKIESENQYTLFLNVADRGRFNGELGENITVRAWSGRPRALRLAFQQCALPLASALAGFDVIHSPSFLLPVWRGRARHLLTVHDMTFFTRPNLHNRLHRSMPFRRAVRMSIRRAHMVNVPSKAARRDLLRLMPDVSAERVRVTPWGIHPRFCPAPSAEVAAEVARLGVPQPYILSLGTIEPRKNQLAILDAFRSLVASGERRLHLVFAGAMGWNTGDILQAASSPDLRDRIHVLGYVSAEALPWLYRGASLFVYPSIDEGFGFPPLEAMACGVPVLASRGSSLEENLSGAADLVPAGNSLALSDAMRELLADPARRKSLVTLGRERAATFRWEDTARSILSCYEDLAAGRIDTAQCGSDGG